VKHLLEKYRGIIDLKSDTNGDTALIIAARNGHNRVVEILLQFGADCSYQNDFGETALMIASKSVKEQLIAFLNKSGVLHQTGIQALLYSAWLGDAEAVRRTLIGKNYIDVNCKNGEGLTPLLLVTRDVGTFEKVQHAMQTEYNPLEVMDELLKHKADVSATDSKGHSALHLLSTTKNIQAKKMVSLLLQHGSNIELFDYDQYTPLHSAAKSGHTAIIVALVEEGDADINQKGGERGETPLMITARGGHMKAAEYLLSKGADVTLVDEQGDTALSMATNPSMITMLKEAWNEQITRSTCDPVNDKGSTSMLSKPCEESDDELEKSTNSIQKNQSVFITQYNLSLTSSANDIARLESIESDEQTNIDPNAANNSGRKNGTGIVCYCMHTWHYCI
jgi:ankyrin repeat protein